MKDAADMFARDQKLIRHCYGQQGLSYDEGLRHLREKKFHWYFDHVEQVSKARANYQYVVSARRRELSIWQFLRERIEAKIR